MSITITIEGQDAAHARREMLALLTPNLGPSGDQWERLLSERAPENDVTAGEIVDALHGALKADTTAEDADGVEFPAETAAAPKKRGRPRKEPSTAFEKISEGLQDAIEIARAPEQLDIEDAIASQVDEPDPINSEALAEHVALSAVEIDEAPQPEDPAAGWTIQDARNAGRALLDRAPDVDTGNRKLAATLVPFGVQQVKALQPDQIEAFVVATQKAVF